MVLYFIVQPVIGDNERGDPDAIDDDAFESESADEVSFEWICLNKERHAIIHNYDMRSLSYLREVMSAMVI